ALLAGFLTAFWFASIANHIKKDALARLKEESVRERERLLVSTEREKSRVFEQTHKQILKETNRAHAKANFKVGAAVIGAVGVGVGLLSMQFVTLGLLPLFAAAGGVAGYGLRARQESRARKEQLAKGMLTRQDAVKPIEVKKPVSIPPPRKASR
ncbi:MAG TPA: hypothetical protein VFL97_03570, partial [Nitrococcus sp.]|nr:hypothetical protein [Nitrococcus sp.]